MRVVSSDRYAERAATLFPQYSGASAKPFLLYVAFGKFDQSPIIIYAANVECPPT